MYASVKVAFYFKEEVESVPFSHHLQYEGVKLQEYDRYRVQ